jgi:hypothetical protein
MKRICVLLSISFLLAACGGKSTPMTAAEPARAAEPETESMSPDGAAPGGSDDDSDGAAQKNAPKPDSDDPCSGDD